ncbi:MAG: GNAT family N-acetyltransferase [Candidatus Brocadiae bacterium]|nr:GNAT family N-acetyltransferase [Candidatus Brocadiia bacterium]
MTIRNFRKSDVPALVELWNSALRQEAGDKQWYLDSYLLSEAKLLWITGNSNFDPSAAFVWEQEGRIVGFAWGVVKKVPSYEGERLEDSPGYLEGFVVDRAFRSRGIGTQLVQKVESYARAASKRTVILTCYHSAIEGLGLLPGSSGHEFLLKRGYEAEPPEMRLRLSFEDYSFPDEVAGIRERLRRDGIEIEYYEGRHEDSFCRLLQRHFRSWWHAIYQPNLTRAEPLPVLIAVDADRVVGFVGFVTVWEGKRAGFTPGVDPQYRRRGIGKVLLNVWARDVKRLGAQESIISTGTDNYPAQRIYFAMGYKKLGEFYSSFTKSLA